MIGALLWFVIKVTTVVLRKQRTGLKYGMAIVAVRNVMVGAMSLGMIRDRRIGLRHIVVRHLVERHLVARHLVERHLVERHLVERHLVERHLVERHLGVRHLVRRRCRNLRLMLRSRMRLRPNRLFRSLVRLQSSLLLQWKTVCLPA
jgi:hypothetical protein